MLSSRLNAFVIPTSQRRPIASGEHVVADDLDREARGQHDAGGRELRRELRERAQRVGVVEQARHEEDRAAAEDPQQLRARFDCTHRDRQPDAGTEAGEDPDAAEARGRALVPALPRRCRDEAAAQVGTQQPGDDESRHGQGDGRNEGAHGRKG